MPRYSLNELLTNVDETFGRIEKLPKQQITSDLNTEIRKWKSQIADACLALVLEPSQLLQSYSFDGSMTDVPRTVTYTTDVPRTDAYTTVASSRDVLLRLKSSLNQNQNSTSVSLSPSSSTIREASAIGEQVSLGSKHHGSKVRVASFDTPDSDYCIDLRAASHILPRRLEGQPREIDETTSGHRSLHQKEIQDGNIICYGATDDGKLVAFKPRARSAVAEVLEVLSFARELHYFSFPKLPQQLTSTYDIRYCAHPNCGEMVETSDHLQLCQSHGEKLMHNIEYNWLSAAPKNIYDAIKNVGKDDSEGIHDRIYYQLLPQLNAWIEQIDRIIPSDCTGTGTRTSSVDAWFVLQLRPMRLLLTLMKSAIFLYRMHLNPAPMAYIIAAIVALVVGALKSSEVMEAIVDGFVRIIRTVCGILAAIFAYVGIGILYTLDLIFGDDAYIAIFLQTVGGTLVIIGTAIAGGAVAGGAVAGGATIGGAIVGGALLLTAAPIAVLIGGIGLAAYLVGNRMRRERDRRGHPHAQLIQVHLDLRLAREGLWQWIG